MSIFNAGFSQIGDGNLNEPMYVGRPGQPIVLNGQPTAVLNTISELTTANTIYTTAIVKDAKRGGIFNWYATGTVDNGITFAGQTGYWVRQYSDFINVLWYGATGTGATNDTAAIQAALDAPGDAAIFFPLGDYSVTGTGVACITLNKKRKIFGDGSASIRADFAGAATAVMAITITSNRGQTEVRRFIMEGLTLFQNGGGSHALIITGGLQIFDSQFNNMTLLANETNGGYGIYGNGQLTWCTIEYCEIAGGINLDACGDGNRILKNIIYGTKCAITLNIIYGAFQTQIKENVLTCRDGAITIVNGSQIEIYNNHMEQVGVNATPYSHHIFIQGFSYQSNSINIIGNNFGGGTNLWNNLVIGNAISTKISKNRFNRTTTYDVLLLASSQYNYVFTDNFGEGGARFQNKFNLYVSDSGTGNFGTLQTTAAPSSGGYAAGMQYYKDSNTGEVVLGASSGGALIAGTVIVTMPTGFKPFANDVVVGASAAGAFSVGINATTGDITASSAIPSNVSVGSGIRFLSYQPN